TRPSGNAIVLSPTDSSYVTGDFFVDGQLRLEVPVPPPFYLQLTSLEFADTLFLIEAVPQAGVIQLPLIELSPPAWDLAAVTVKSTRPTYRQKPDGSVEVTVAETMLSTSSSVEDLLRLTPEIQFDDAGNLSVLGKGAATIFLDGRRVLPSQLATVLPANIATIEIIRNPSARYDAEGNAVIHIHTIARSRDGQQLQATQNLEYSPYAGSKMQTNLQGQLARGRWNWSSFYNFERGRDVWQQITTRDRTDEDIFFSSAVTTRWQPLLRHASRYGLGVQQRLGTGTYWSLDYAGQYREVGGLIAARNVLADLDGQGVFGNETAQSVLERNHSLSFNYQQALDSLGSSLFVGAQYNDFAEATDNTILETSVEGLLDSQRRLLNIGERRIRITTLQLDWTQALSAEAQLEAGIKGSSVSNDSATDFLQTVDTEGTLERDPTLSNVFNYREYIAAAYVSVNGKWGQHWQYTLGLRTEWTDYDVAVAAQAAAIADRYWAVFPNLSVNYRWNDDYQLHFSYRAGINRQPYDDLNPALIYQDPFTSIQGNPFLVPERVHALEINTQLRQLRWKTGYNYVRDPLGAAA
ncbi:MAG: TonB-dependent receptor, partial [Bacteroidota bacterium]